MLQVSNLELLNLPRVKLTGSLADVFVDDLFQYFVLFMKLH